MITPTVWASSTAPSWAKSRPSAVRSSGTRANQVPSMVPTRKNTAATATRRRRNPGGSGGAGSRLLSGTTGLRRAVQRAVALLTGPGADRQMGVERLPVPAPHRRALVREMGEHVVELDHRPGRGDAVEHVLVLAAPAAVALVEPADPLEQLRCDPQTRAGHVPKQQPACAGERHVPGAPAAPLLDQAVARRDVQGEHLGVRQVCVVARAGEPGMVACQELPVDEYVG